MAGTKRVSKKAGSTTRKPRAAKQEPKELDEKFVEESLSHLRALSENTFSEYEKEKHKMKEMLLGKKIDNVRSGGGSGVDERIYKDLSVNRPSGSMSTNSESIISRKIIQYREMSRNPELEDIIRDIVNEAVVTNGMDDYPVKLYISEESGIVQKINKVSIEKVYKKFRDIMEKFAFDVEAMDIFERWYVDGRLYVWTKRNSGGKISSYEILDPILLSLKVDNEKKNPPVYIYNNNQEIPVLGDGTNYGAGAFNQGILGKSSYSGLSKSEAEAGQEIPYQDVTVVFSGAFDHLMKIYISPIEKALKILNQLNNLEDAMVMYQFIRAVPRRVFKIDTGNLPPKDREAHLNTIQKRHRESLNLKYNTDTGAIEGDEKVRFLSMFDDYWIATFDGDKTDIGALDTPTSEWDTITTKLGYFRMKLYRAMNVPFSRYQAQMAGGEGEQYKVAADTLGRTEAKFNKYINSLRKRFSDLFYNLLEKEVIEDKIFSPIEWSLLKKRITIEWEDDNDFTAVRKYDIMKRQTEVIQLLDPLVGKYFTRDYIYREILGKNDEDITMLEEKLAEEAQKYGAVGGAEGEAGGGIASTPGGGGTEVPAGSGIDFGAMSFENPAGEASAPAEGAPAQEAPPTQEAQPGQI